MSFKGQASTGHLYPSVCSWLCKYLQIWFPSLILCYSLGLRLHHLKSCLACTKAWNHTWLSFSCWRISSQQFVFLILPILSNPFCIWNSRYKHIYIYFLNTILAVFSPTCKNNKMYLHNMVKVFIILLSIRIYISFWCSHYKKGLNQSLSAQSNGIFICTRTVSGVFCKVTVSVAQCGETSVGDGQYLVMGGKGWEVLILNPTLYIDCAASRRHGFRRD